MADYVTAFGMMEATSQEGGFQVSSRSKLLNLVSEVHCNFSNKDLPSTSVRQPSAKAIAHTVLELIFTVMTSNFNGGFSCLGLGVLLDGLQLLEILSVQVI